MDPIQIYGGLLVIVSIILAFFARWGEDD